MANRLENKMEIAVHILDESINAIRERGIDNPLKEVPEVVAAMIKITALKHYKYKKNNRN